MPNTAFGRAELQLPFISVVLSVNFHVWRWAARVDGFGQNFVLLTASLHQNSLQPKSTGYI